MIVAVALTVLGLLMGIVVVQAHGLRLSGVLVVPLFAVYALYDFVALPTFVLGVIAAYAGLSVLQRHTFLFGRQLLIAAMAISMAVPFVTVVALSAAGTNVTMSELTFIGSILPGVAAYNYHQLDETSRRLEDVVASAAALVGLIGLGAGLLSATVAPYLSRLTPQVLYAAESDMASFHGTDGVGEEAVLGAPLALVFLAIIGGMVVAEAAYRRWIRLNGIIALPLLAFFAFRSAAIVPLYVVGVVAVYAITTFVHRTTLLYGRVLLALALIVALLGSIPVAMVLPAASGLYMYFTAILIGVGAYNLHRMPAAHRPTSAALSAAGFVLFCAGLRPFVSPEAGGILADPGPASLAVGGIVLLVGIATAARLESLRPSADERRRIVSNDSHT